MHQLRNMETWFIIIITITTLFLSALLKYLTFPTKTISLPPGPLAIPFITNFLWLRKSFSDLEPILRNLHAKYGPIVTLPIGSRPSIFVSNRSLAHQALVQNGALYADRPPALPTVKIISCNQHSINSANYGPTWRLLRRNISSEILHPSRIKSYSHARKWVLDILLNRFMSQSKSGSTDPIPIRVIDHFYYAMFCLLVFMCFGDKLGDAQIKQIEHEQRRSLVSSLQNNILNFCLPIGKVLFRKRWKEFYKLRKDHEAVLIPLIEARKKVMQERLSNGKEDVRGEVVVTYVDTLLGLQLPEEKRKLEAGEIVSLCSEFLNAGTDTTSTALQWIMANLVKYPFVQERVFEEIKEVVGEGGKEVKEEDLHKTPYLKAVVLEGLRRHPPAHFVLPHAVIEDVVLDGYLVPKNATLNFMVAEMGWDPKVWKDPMAFKPERFLSSGDGGGEVFDITGSKEIKMMPFGAGRRICPGSGLAILHLEYFVANLVWNFEWRAVEGDDVDLSEKQEFTVVMKNPLKVYIFPRF